MSTTPTDDAALRIARAVVAAKNAHAAANPGAQFMLAHAAAAIRAQLAIEFPPAPLADAAVKDSLTAAPAPKAKRAQTTATTTDDEWLRSLEVMECYRYVDVRRELGKAQVWASGNKREMSRRRFINWLNKADATIGYDARGKSSGDAQKPKSNAPAGWLSVLRRLYPDSTYCQAGGHFEITDETDYAWSQLDKGVQRAIVGDVTYGTKL
jgi:hypothetical protein